MDIFEDGVAASGYTNATFQAAILYIKATTTAYPVVTFYRKTAQKREPVHAESQKYDTLR
ncbi:hypothetical protein ACMV8I_02285 [Ewingella sp. S1.OA.A_B6]